MSGRYYKWRSLRRQFPKIQKILRLQSHRKLRLLRPSLPLPRLGSAGGSAGSKDKAPRVKVRVEPIPQPEPKPAPAQSGVASDAPPAAAGDLPDKSSPVAERPPSPEPPSPRTLFRQTSEHLLNLREVMNSQKRASAAEKYTSRLHAWPVV